MVFPFSLNSQVVSVDVPPDINPVHRGGRQEPLAGEAQQRADDARHVAERVDLAALPAIDRRDLDLGDAEPEARGAHDHLGLDLTSFRMLEIKNGDWTLVN